MTFPVLLSSQNAILTLYRKYKTQQNLVFITLILKLLVFMKTVFPVY